MELSGFKNTPTPKIMENFVLLFDNKIEIGLWKRLVYQRVMPPFFFIVPEPMLFHHLFQQSPVALLLRPDFFAVCPRKGMKAVESGSHIDTVVPESFLLRQIAFAQFLSVDIGFLRGEGNGYDGKIHRTAPAVSGATRDKSVFKQAFFVDGRIKFLFHLGVSGVFGPSDKMINGPLRSVAVIEF